MNEHKCDCKQISVIIRGNKPDGTDGLLYNAMRTHEEVFGTPENPGGLVREVREHREETRKLALKVSGIVGGITLLLHFGPELIKHFLK